VEKDFHSADLAKEKIFVVRKFHQAVPSKTDVGEFSGGVVQPVGNTVQPAGSSHTSRNRGCTPYGWAEQAVVQVGGK